MTDDIVRYRDFSLSPEPITFEIAPDVFTCFPEIALDTLAEMSGLSLGGGGDTGSQLSKIYDFFDGIMEPDSAARFRERGRKSTKENPNPYPIGMRHVMDILPWLMEMYGLRPTQPSDESQGGSDGTATSSTDGVSPTDSIS